MASRSTPSSVPLGVSRIIGTARNRASSTTRRNGSRPRWPRPIPAWRSTRLPRSRRLSLRCQTRTRLDSDGPVQRIHRFIVLLRGRQGIARRENVAGVDANAQPLGLGDPVEDRARGARTGARGRSPAPRSSPGRSAPRLPGSGAGPRRAPPRPGAAPPPRPARRAPRGGSPGRSMPSASQRSTSTVMASIDFSQSASSGLPRLIRYELCTTGSTIPVSARADERPRRGRRSAAAPSTGCCSW